MRILRQLLLLVVILPSICVFSQTATCSLPDGSGGTADFYVLEPGSTSAASQGSYVRKG